MTAELAHILNWRRVDANITLSGQPTEDQLRDLQQSGVRRIIILGPRDNDGALTDEAASVAHLGMQYTYIPVDFDAPTEADYNQFRAALADAAGTKTHIHCIYNARVTAFMTRLAADGHGEDTAKARARMDSIWRPGGVWAAFLGDGENTDQPNRYAGYDY
jgi:protein tyrosine phosphatase (PTP) superfamily phosphohydrolase (DUF442 family)